MINMDNSLDYINDRIEKISNLLFEMNYYGKEEKQFKSSDNFYQNQLNIIEENMPKESLTSIIYNFINSQNKEEMIKSNLTKRTLSHKNYDHLAMECLILEKLLEFGMISSLYEIPNIQPIHIEISDAVAEYGPYHLFEMFHKDEKTQYAMIDTFVKYMNCPAIKKGVYLDYLDGTKHRLRYEYTEAILDCKKMDSTNPVKTNKKMDVIELIKFLKDNRDFLQNTAATQLVYKK